MEDHIQRIALLLRNLRAIRLQLMEIPLRCQHKIHQQWIPFIITDNNACGFS
jgi:hypothetical protein